MLPRTRTLALAVMALGTGCALDWKAQEPAPDAEVMGDMPDASSDNGSTDAASEDAATAQNNDATVEGPDASADDDASVPAPTEPPKIGLRGWFRGDECAAATDGLVHCTDLSQTGSTLRSSEANAASIHESGIGGKRAVAFSRGLFRFEAQKLRADRFTITTVYRATYDEENRNTTMLWHSSETIQDGEATRTQTARIVLRSSRSEVEWWSNFAVSGPGTRVTFTAPETPKSKPRVGAIITLVADAASGLRLYANGVLIGGSPLAVPKLLLDGSLLLQNATSGSSEFAEALVYGRSLSDRELTSLHRYLGARYDIALDGMRAWFDAGDIFAARQATDGISPESGVGVATKDKLYDRFLSSIYPHSEGSAGGLSLFDDSGTRYGLDSGGSAYLSPRTYGDSVCHYSVGSASCGATVEHCSNPDFLELWMLRIDETPDRFPLWYSGRLAAPGQYANLGGVGSTRSLELAWTDASNKTTTTSSAEGVVPMGEPFLLGIYSSAQHHSIQVSINGKVQVTVPEHACPSGLAASTPILHLPRGALAERRLYRGPFTDAQVKRLQRELGAKFDIAVE